MQRNRAAKGGILVSWRSWNCSLAQVHRAYVVRGSRNRSGWTERRRHVLVDGLAFVVVLGMHAAIRAGDGLRGLVRFEAQVPLLILVCLLEVADSFVAKHHIVVRLQVFRIDGQR